MHNILFVSLASIAIAFAVAPQEAHTESKAAPSEASPADSAPAEPAAPANNDPLAMDDPLAELASLGDAVSDSGPEGGGSIRAKRNVEDPATKRMANPANFEGRVEEIKQGRFPMAAIRIKLTRPAKEGAGAQLAANQTIVVLPKLATRDGRLALNDPSTLINAGAFYLKRGDRVVVQLAEQRGDKWIASYIERK